MEDKGVEREKICAKLKEEFGDKNPDIKVI